MTKRSVLPYPERYVEAFRKVRSWEELPLGVRIFDPKHSGAGNDVIGVNRHGFRSRDFEINEDDEFRIVLLGGSAAWGTGATSNEATVAGQLEMVLNAELKFGGREKVVCFNLAMPAATSQHELLYFLFWGLRLRPHCVVALTGGNDLFAQVAKPHAVSIFVELADAWDRLLRPITEHDIRKKRRLLIREAARNARDYAETFRLLGWVQRLRWHVARLKRRFITPPSSGPIGLANDQVTVDGAVFKEQMECFAHNYSVVYDVCKANGTAFVLFIQPHLYSKVRMTPEEEQGLDYFTNRHGAQQRYRVARAFHRKHNIFQAYKRTIEERCPRLAPALFDLTDAFHLDSDWLFYSTVHMTDQGYAKTAREIARVIMERGMCSQGGSTALAEGIER